MGAFLSIPGLLPAIAASISLGILFFQEYQRRLFHHYVQEQRQLRQQLQQMQRRRRVARADLEQISVQLNFRRANFVFKNFKVTVNCIYFVKISFFKFKCS